MQWSWYNLPGSEDTLCTLLPWFLRTDPWFYRCKPCAGLSRYFWSELQFVVISNVGIQNGSDHALSQPESGGEYMTESDDDLPAAIVRINDDRRVTTKSLPNKVWNTSDYEEKEANKMISGVQDIVSRYNPKRDVSWAMSVYMSSGAENRTLQ